MFLEPVISILLPPKNVSMYVRTMYKIITYVCTIVIVISFRVYSYYQSHFLNQARTCFLDIAFVQEIAMSGLWVCICVCVHPWAIKNNLLEVKSE